jgi:dinuclear metal center YbgI/SA1388 family protein
MRISDLVAAAENIAPPALAEDWDNVGLLVGSESWTLSGPVLLTIDLTEAVAREAIAMRAGAVIAYHPPLFHAIKRITDGPASSAAERIVLSMIREGIAIYSPHTALDATTGGITDWLADGLAGGGSGGVKAGDRRALRSFIRRDPLQEVKLVTFVPEKDAARVREALASAGAGLIGEYELCSFSSPGTGTFRGSKRSKPTVGEPGVLETAPELRLEMVCARRAVALAITILRQFHPYEEPAIDVYPLEPKPDRSVGAGRRLMLDHPASLNTLADRLKAHLKIGAVQVAAAGGDLNAPVSRIGLVPGAGASLAMEARADGCEVFVTGEMKHHEVNAALAAGLSVILGGHTPTERGYLPTYAAALHARLPTVDFRVSAADRDPLVLR